MRKYRIAVCSVGFLLTFAACAHDGLLDSYGCHPNVAHGTYHCHQGPLAERQYPSRDDMVRAFHEQERGARAKPTLQPAAIAGARSDGAR